MPCETLIVLERNYAQVMRQNRTEDLTGKHFFARLLLAQADALRCTKRHCPYPRLTPPFFRHASGHGPEAFNYEGQLGGGETEADFIYNHNLYPSSSRSSLERQTQNALVLRIAAAPKLHILALYPLITVPAWPTFIVRPVDVHLVLVSLTERAQVHALRQREDTHTI